MNTLESRSLPSKDELLIKFKEGTITPEEKDMLILELTKSDDVDAGAAQNNANFQKEINEEKVESSAELAEKSDLLKAKLLGESPDNTQNTEDNEFLKENSYIDSQYIVEINKFINSEEYIKKYTFMDKFLGFSDVKYDELKKMILEINSSNTGLKDTLKSIENYISRGKDSVEKKTELLGIFLKQNIDDTLFLKTVFNDVDFIINPIVLSKHHNDLVVKYLTNIDLYRSVMSDIDVKYNVGLRRVKIYDFIKKLDGKNLPDSHARKLIDEYLSIGLEPNYDRIGTFQDNIQYYFDDIINAAVKYRCPFYMEERDTEWLMEKGISKERIQNAITQLQQYQNFEDNKQEEQKVGRKQHLINSLQRNELNAQLMSTGIINIPPINKDMKYIFSYGGNWKVGLKANPDVTFHNEILGEKYKQNVKFGGFVRVDTETKTITFSGKSFEFEGPTKDFHPVLEFITKKQYPDFTVMFQDS